LNEPETCRRPEDGDIRFDVAGIVAGRDDVGAGSEVEDANQRVGRKIPMSVLESPSKSKLLYFIELIARM
jgi:hypothetical protein